MNAVNPERAQIENAAAVCFHCGDPVPAHAPFLHTDGGARRQFCCEGCRTAFRVISAGGLDAYYRYRDEYSPRPATDGVERQLYDLCEAKLQAGEDGRLEVILRVEGIHCASCVWLNEKVLAGLPGVLSAEVRLGTNRAYLAYNSKQISLSEIAASVARVGYRLTPLDGALVQAEGGETRDLLRRMGVAGFFAGNMMLVSVSLYAGYFDTMDRFTRNFLHLVSFAFAVPVVLYSAAVFFRGAFAALRHRVPAMDLLTALGISLAFGYSCYSALHESGEVYFDSITFVVFAVLTGRFLESRLRQRGMQQVENLRAASGRPVTLHPEGRAILAGDVRAGMAIQIAAGETVPADGELLDEKAEFDEALLTGEYRPVARRAGDAILAGSRVVGGAVLLRATRDYGASTLARLHDLVEAGLRETSPAARLAEAAGRWFVVFVLIASCATFVYWTLIGEMGRGIHATIALLIVACPCALSLSIPIARIVALEAAYRRGILLKNGAALETLARAKILVLDKTGTLTGGRPRVIRVEQLAGKRSENELLVCARRLQTLAHVRHPVAEAFRSALISDETGVMLPEAAQYVPGRGVRGTGAGRTYLLGSRAFMEENGVPGLDEESADDGALRVYLAEGPEAGPGATPGLAAIFYLADETRPEASLALTELRRRLRPIMLTGDTLSGALRVAGPLGITDVYAGQSPEDKRVYVRAQRAHGVVCMVGDGINDAAALAAADCGISFAEASEISLHSADVLLLKNDLRELAFLFRLARRARSKMIQNLALSFAYNVLLIPLAFLGLIVPVLGAAFMALSSLTVVANSLLLVVGRNPGDRPAVV